MSSNYNSEQDDQSQGYTGYRGYTANQQQQQQRRPYEYTPDHRDKHKRRISAMAPERLPVGNSSSNSNNNMGRKVQEPINRRAVSRKGQRPLNPLQPA